MKSILASFLVLVSFVGLAFLEGSSSAVPRGHASFTHVDESGIAFPVHTFRPESWTPTSPIVLVSGPDPLVELAAVAEERGALIVAPVVADAALLSDDVRERIFDRLRQETGTRRDGFERSGQADALRAGL